MKLSKLIIKNFRNFQDVSIELSNKNVVFGMNDVGKTNLLSSLRYLLDRKLRANGFIESDFYQRDTSKVIEITLEIDLSDREESNDSQNIISKVVGARTSTELNLFYFQVRGNYNYNETLGILELYWGNNLDDLQKVPQNGNYSDIDKIFNVIYIDPSIDLDEVFNRNSRRIFNQNLLSGYDNDLSKEITELTIEMNRKISTMDIITSLQQELTSEYRSLKNEDISIELQSEMAIKGFFSDLHPYIKKENDDQLYPTSGDGRKKILAYSLLNYLTKEFDSNKISIFLIEEPENSLHRSMQIALSKQLFDYSVYNYFILSTHSSELLYEMDHATLVRIYSRNKTNCESHLYEVPSKFTQVKKELNEALTIALFSDRVLLIEGPSEKVLFEKILSVIRPTYELEGGYILVVDGIKFKPYFETLNALNITPIVKTDNDLKAKRNHINQFDLIGFNRCLDLIGMKEMSHIDIDYSSLDENDQLRWLVSDKKIKVFENKKSIYEMNSQLVDKFEKENIFLSQIDLENDLNEVIPEKMTEVFGENAVKTLQDKKLLHMLKLINCLSDEDCRLIYEHSNFKSLRKLVEN